MRHCCGLLLVGILVAGLGAQYPATLATGTYASVGLNGGRPLVRGPDGTLYMLSVQGSASVVAVLQASTDGGQSWASLVPVFSASPPTVQGTALAIDSRGMLHGAYVAGQDLHYRSFDPRGGVLGSVVPLGTSYRSQAGLDIAVDERDRVFVIGTGSDHRLHLFQQRTVGSGSGPFDDRGAIGEPGLFGTEPAITVDRAGRVHMAWVLDSTTAGVFHRIYDAQGLGPVQPLDGSFGLSGDGGPRLVAGGYGRVHALWMNDSRRSAFPSTVPWSLRYDVWDPNTGGWSGTPLDVLGGSTTSQSGLSDHRIYDLMVEHHSGRLWIVLRNFAAGGAFQLLARAPNAPGFTLLRQLSPGRTVTFGDWLPRFRGRLWPAFDRTRSQLDLGYHFKPGFPTNAGELRFDTQPLASVGDLRMQITPPLNLGGTSTLTLSAGFGAAFQTYLCAFSETDGPEPSVLGGPTLPIDPNGFLFLWSLDPFNPIFQGTLGGMDANATAQVIIRVPNVPALSGYSLEAAAVTLDPTATSGLGAMGGPLRLTIP